MNSEVWLDLGLNLTRMILMRDDGLIKPFHCSLDCMSPLCKKFTEVHACQELHMHLDGLWETEKLFIFIQ